MQETKHEKIFIGKPSEFDLNVLKDEIDELLEIAQNRNNEQLRVKLKEVVPTYNRVYIDEVAASKE